MIIWTHLILALFSVGLFIVFVKYAFNCDRSGLPGVGAIVGFLLVFVSGLPLTLVPFGLIRTFEKYFNQKIPEAVQVLSVVASSGLQWIIWSQIIAWTCTSIWDR